MGINFEASNWYASTKAQYQVGGARQYSEAVGKGQQAVGESLSSDVAPDGESPKALPTLSLLEMFGQWFHGLFNRPDNSQALLRDPGPDGGTPVPSQTAGSNVDTVLAPEGQPAAPSSQVEASA